MMRHQDTRLIIHSAPLAQASLLDEHRLAAYAAFAAANRHLKLPRPGTIRSGLMAVLPRPIAGWAAPEIKLMRQAENLVTAAVLEQAKPRLDIAATMAALPRSAVPLALTTVTEAAFVWHRPALAVTDFKALGGIVAESRIMHQRGLVTDPAIAVWSNVVRSRMAQQLRRTVQTLNR